MSRLRKRWLALFGGVTLIALSMSTAFAGKPDGTPRGLEVSAFVHSLVGDVEETEDTEEQVEEETETEDETEVETEESSPSDHGKCVAAVAQDPEAVGPPNDNHGGAVNEAARVTCWDDEASDESTGEEAPQDDGDAEVESEDSEEGDASGGDHGKGHGRGHGGDSSED
jgi:hypothetical protein